MGFLYRVESITVPSYDCEGRGTNFTVYSLNDIEHSPEIKEMEHRTNQTIQVIQRREYEATFVYNCDIKITRTIIAACPPIVLR